MSVAARAAPAGDPTPAQRAVPPERQILWQRSLEDALSIAKEEKRPLLIAVNMDGESASERIVREQYRDPKFVASTRPFVCLMASVFRHTPRDYDEQGRRIPCPRLGEVTCGEHIALEPILYDKYLQGDRIAPRHALILRDGTKSFDLTLLFDLHDVDKKLVESVLLAPPVIVRSEPMVSAAAIASDLDPARRAAQWNKLAAARDQRGRAAFEDVLLQVLDEATLSETLQAIQHSGDAGSIGALRILLPKSELFSESFVERLAQTARDLQLSLPVAAAVRERLSGLGPYPGTPGIGADAKLLPLLAWLDGSSTGVRSVLIAYDLVGAHGEEARRGLSRVLGVDDLKSLGSCELLVDAPFDLAQMLRFAEIVTARMQPIAKPSEALPSTDAIERELEALDAAMKKKPANADMCARYGIASLNLARHRIESKGPGVQLLLEDAQRWLEAAARKGRNDVHFNLERARTAYFQGQYADEVKFGDAALDSVGFRPIMSAAARAALDECKATDPAWRTSKEVEVATRVLEDVDVVEALRWIGDGHARLLESRSGGKVFDEAFGIHRGIVSLALVATSLSSDETDWTSLGSFFGALGMNREELACLQQGALRLPESTALRASLNGALWSGGRIDLAPAKAEWILSKHPDSAASMWFAGYAHILGAEDWRRREEPDRALDAYARADARFRESAEKKPEFEGSAKHYRAMCALGRGFAHSIADRRDRAAEALIEAIALEPDVVQARDGLDREAIDLLDTALEWRISGKSPVDPLAMLTALERADPKNAGWARAVSDSELREALRADGRKDATEGDRYLQVSIIAARRGVAIADDETNRRPLAQSLTVDAERRLARGEVENARKLLVQAAPLVGETAPDATATAEDLKMLAGDLRRKLGAARPVFRPGR
jgi:tetratricopeptide (TPR) repeat protein